MNHLRNNIYLNSAHENTWDPEYTHCLVEVTIDLIFAYFASIRIRMTKFSEVDMMLLDKTLQKNNGQGPHALKATS